MHLDENVRNSQAETLLARAEGLSLIDDRPYRDWLISIKS